MKDHRLIKIIAVSTAAVITLIVLMAPNAFGAEPPKLQRAPVLQRTEPLAEAEPDPIIAHFVRYGFQDVEALEMDDTVKKIDDAFSKLEARVIDLEEKLEKKPVQYRNVTKVTGYRQVCGPDGCYDVPITETVKVPVDSLEAEATTTTTEYVETPTCPICGRSDCVNAGLMATGADSLNLTTSNVYAERRSNARLGLLGRFIRNRAAVRAAAGRVPLFPRLRAYFFGG